MNLMKNKGIMIGGVIGVLLGIIVTWYWHREHAFSQTVYLIIICSLPLIGTCIGNYLYLKQKK